MSFKPAWAPARNSILKYKAKPTTVKGTTAARYDARVFLNLAGIGPFSLPVLAEHMSQAHLILALPSPDADWGLNMWSKQDLESPSLELVKRHKGERGLSQRFSKKMMQAWSYELSTSLEAWKKTRSCAKETEQRLWRREKDLMM